jgi:lipid-A-disaccharide synthase-like uncharacterized protein
MDESNNRSLMPLLVATFKIQIFGVGLLKVIIIDDDDSIFGAVASNEVTLHGLLKNLHNF